MSETLYLIALILALVIIVGQTAANAILLYQVHRRNEQIKQLNKHIQAQDDKIELLEEKVDTLNEALVKFVGLQQQRVFEPTQRQVLQDVKDMLTINNNINSPTRNIDGDANTIKNAGSIGEALSGSEGTQKKDG